MRCIELQRNLSNMHGQLQNAFLRVSELCGSLEKGIYRMLVQDPSHKNPGGSAKHEKQDARQRIKSQYEDELRKSKIGVRMVFLFERRSRRER